MSNVNERLSQQLKKWREELINLSRVNRLLYFRHSKTASLEIVSPGPQAILDRLNANGAGNLWDFYLAPAAGPDDTASPPIPRATDLVVQDKDAVATNAALRLLERKANQEFVDRGLWTLYLSLGMLEWIDHDDGAKVHSPLLLVPVTFARQSLQEPFRLRVTDDDTVINPALVAKMRNDLGIELPTADELEELSVGEVSRRVTAAVKNQKGWSVQERTVLTTFTFHKEAMYRDLLDNDSLIASHPMVQMLALGPDSPSSGEFAFEPMSEDALDEVVAPEELVSVLDADASQRRCILDARQGHSFVMDGPPGTGKSQTIVNIIAELIHAGRTVLFVSEKAAALEVVFERLRAAKLDEFALQLHSHNATRKAVATELGRALTTRPTARTSMAGTSVAKLKQDRSRLSGYAQALNEVRRPLGRSLHDALGRILQLQGQSQAPVPSAIGLDLSPEQFSRVLDAAETLGRNWGPVVRGEGFLWRDLAETTLSAARQSELERAVEEARTNLAALAGLLDVLDTDLGLGWKRSAADALRAHNLLHLISDRRDVPSEWLTAASLDVFNRIVEDLAQASARYEDLVDGLCRDAGDCWTHVVPRFGEAMSEALAALREMTPSPEPGSQATTDELRGTLEFLRSCSPLLQAIDDDAQSVAVAFGLPQGAITLERAAQLAELGGLLGSPAQPEPEWLDPLSLPAAEEAASVLSAAVAAYRKERDELVGLFTEDVLQLDLEGLRTRFLTLHKGLGKLRSAYRADKKTLAACTTGGNGKLAIAGLDDAIGWKEQADVLKRAEQRHAPILGNHYYQGTETDFDRLAAAITIARLAVSLAGDDIDVSSLRRQVGRGGVPDLAAATAARRLGSNTTSFISQCPAPLASLIPALVSMPNAALAIWADHSAEEFAQVVKAHEHVEEAIGSRCSLAAAGDLLGRASEAEKARHEVESDDERHRALLGPQFVGISSDWEALRSSMLWAKAVRELCGGPLPTKTAEAIRQSGLTPDAMGERMGRWDKAERALLDAFSPSRAADVAADLEASFEDGASLLEELAVTRGDIEEWATYAEAIRTLEREGLGEIVRFCVERRLLGAQVAGVIERALLEAWSDAIISRDGERLAPARATERDALRTDFQALDRELVANAAAGVINECAARRPTSLAGAAGVIQRQAQLQRKHMPIQELLKRAGTVAQQLKPCFMMSPLSVSQYLPAGLTFDVVIFDEASQVRPSDAINCVYRGRQLIVAGDQKQLPPSSFFVRGAADGDGNYDEDELEDFESVLDLCKASGGLTSLPLNWHYRSQHESLITYSNYSFYDGRLSTFPGATQVAEDLGIELFKVDGVYRRGGGRDNPVEAAKVIDRVLFHRLHHPDLSIGVVAFSQSQEDAIVRELERRASDRPELAGLIGEDRLRGFFVKNLEDVQGDERDIIVFSLGYGPDEFGKFTLQMGPLNKQGGWRRLNVAITRARRRVEIVTSILPANFVGDLKADGVRHLRRYLDFALRGMPALALDLAESAGDVESPFEEEVVRSLRSWGYEVVPQVGCASYRIDIGVRDPRTPGQFLLAVECDGAMYHSSPVARDRDRLRQSVLEGLGWRFHRIWGIAWFRDRLGEEERLRRAIEDAMAEDTTVPRGPVSGFTSPEVAVEEVDFSAPPPWVQPYQPCHLPLASNGFEIHEPEARPRLRELVRKAVEEETPVHEERVLRTVREAWGVGRAGHRIRSAFDGVVSDLVRHTVVERDQSGFLRLVGSGGTLVRIPTSDPSTIRPVDHIPPDELEQAVIGVVRDAHAIGKEELRVRVARLFGWGRTGADISEAIDDATAEVIYRRVLQDDGEYLRATQG